MDSGGDASMKRKGLPYSASLKKNGSPSSASVTRPALPRACAVCSDNKGLCEKGPRIKKFFGVKLRPGFRQRTTTHGFQFPVEVVNEAGRTFIIGNAWTKFARLYRLDVGSEIIFEIDTPGPVSRVITGTYPITHPAHYHLPDEKREIMDNLTATEGTTVKWKMMGTIIGHVNRLETMVEHHDGRNFDPARVYALVHTINYSNTKKNFVKLPCCLLPIDMEQSGEIIIVSHPHVRVATNYTISIDDGRACINGWELFMDLVPALVIGQKVLMMLYLGENGIYLFVCHVPQIDLK
ncbi:hypothetical protein ACQ4PT_053533 [Festuca glaucescens]